MELQKLYHNREVFAGIDVHKQTYWVVCRCEGVVVGRTRMASSPSLLCGYLLRNFKAAKIRAVYESGFSGFSLQRALSESGIECMVVHAAAVEAASNRKVKTDKRDALKLASHLEARLLKAIRVPSVEEELARLLIRQREMWVRDRSRIMARFKMRLYQFGLERLIGCGGKFTQKKAAAIAASPEVPEKLREALTELIEVWEAINAQVDKIEREMAEQAPKNELVSVFLKHDGIGPVAAWTVALELGDMRQFQNEERLFSFVGLTPGEDSSGETTRKGNITRQGNPRLRRVLVESAWKAIGKDKELKAAFERISKKGGKRKAIVAIARKLIGRMRAAARKRLAGEEWQLAA